MILASGSEVDRRDAVMAEVLDRIKTSRTIPAGHDDFKGSVGEYDYSFEGEDDLLHVSVSRKDGGPITVEEAQVVARFLLPNVPVGLIWLKPGTTSHHFYLGHDELLRP